MIGTSAADNSTIILSIPKPANADIKCSIVATLVLFLIKVVPRFVSPTDFASAGISTKGSISTLLKIIPMLIPAGLRVIKTFFPVCKPTPVAFIVVFIVLCLNITYWSDIIL